MKRNPSTRGKIARLVQGAEAVEIKATIHTQQVKAALARYHLDASNDEERYIYFFDTPKLDLFKIGIIARARRKVGDEHDSTIKFRPINPDTVSSHWRKYSGFKIEADASAKGIVVSGSLTMPVEKGHIKLVAAGREPIVRLFTEEQQLFLLSLAERKLDYSKAVVLGPVRAWRWKFSDPGLPWPLTAELWRRGDGESLLEISIKAPAVQAAAAGAGFMAFLAEVGAHREENEQAKTRWALHYFAEKFRLRAVRPAPRRRTPRTVPRNPGGLNSGRPSSRRKATSS